MNNWILLNRLEYDEVWDRFYEVFKFKPSVHKEDWPTFKEPKPFATYDISHIWGNSNFQTIYDDFHKKALQAFKECTSVGELIYALDWQHSCYWVNPRIDFKLEEVIYVDGTFEKWPIEAIPNGDYYIFLPKDFRWGILGHPWEKSICIYGEELIRYFEKANPVLFGNILRKSQIA